MVCVERERGKKEAPAGNVSKGGSLKSPIVTVATGSLHQLEGTDGGCATGSICSNEQRPFLQMEGGEEAGSET